MIRAPIGDATPSEEEEEWWSKHQKEVNDACAKMAGKDVQGELKTLEAEQADEKELRARVTSGIVSEMVEEKEGVWVCLRCGKAFRGKEFVEKHMNEMHKDVVEQRVIQVGVDGRSEE